MTGKNATSICLTVPNKILEQIDLEIADKVYNTSRQQWINAAITEKLQRDLNTSQEKVSDGPSDGLGC